MTYLAATDTVAYRLGYLSIPIAGVVLVVLGIVYKVRAGRADRQMPGWPPHYPYPPGPPPQGLPPQYPPGPPPQGWPAPGWPGGPPPPKSTHARTGTVLLTIGGILLGGTVMSAIGNVGRPETVAAHPDLSTILVVGQCFTDTSAFEGEFNPTDCSDPTAVIELASRGASGNCPDGKSGEGSQYSSVHDGGTTYCFVLNLQRGRCYAVDDVRKTVKLDDCSAHRSTQVIERVDGSTDVSVCDAAKPVTFPRPPRVYCLARS